MNSLPALRHHLSEEFERPVGVTPEAVAGVSAPHRHARSDVRSLCAQAIYLGLFQAYWIARLLWYPGVASRCCGLCAWACGPQESWRGASAGLTPVDRPMQWTQARPQAVGPRDFGATVTPPASPSLTSRCCVWAGGPQGFGVAVLLPLLVARSAGLTLVDRPLPHPSRSRTWTLRSPVHLWLASTPQSRYARWLVC